MRKRYTGDWQGDLPHGQGTYVYRDGGATYTGSWQKGVRHGKGAHRSEAGVYEGEWFNNRRHGFGVLDLPNGDHFEGTWVEDEREGEGVYFYYDAEKKAHTRRYDGEWVSGTPRCGFYSEMPPDALAPSGVGEPGLPPCELADADRTLAERIGKIRESRARVRAEPAALETLFTPEEMNALSVAFERVDTSGRGEISLEELPLAFAEVAMEPSGEEVLRALAHLGKQEEAATFSFAEFAQAADFLSPVEVELEDRGDW